MTLTAIIDGREVPLHLERQGDVWVANGRPASVLEVEPGVYSILLDGRSFEARIERTPAAWAVTIAGRRFEIEISDPRRLSRRGRSPLREGRETLVAPMPGKVIRLLAAQGAHLEAGQGIAIIEAMKMQNEVKSPKSGRLTTLHIQEGATVAAGDLVAEID
jgi:biotin carboxyl carrier protein